MKILSKSREKERELLPNSVKPTEIGEPTAEGTKPLKNLRKSIHLEQNIANS